MGLEDEDVEMSSPSDRRYKGRNSQRNFLNQTTALAKKSAINQWRQYKTNACQVFFPLALVVLLKLLQLLVTSFVQDQEGTVKPAIPNPPTLPFFLYESNKSWADNCPKGPVLPPIPEPFGFQYLDATGAGDNFTRSVDTSGVYVQKGLVYLDRGDLQQFCEKQFFVADEVTWTKFPDKKTLDDQIYEDNKVNQRLGGFFLNALSMTELRASIFYNETLTQGKDLPIWLDFLGSTWLRMITGGNVPSGGNLTSMILAGQRDFPTKETRPDFDLISLIGPYLYVYIFQLTFPVILGSIVYEKENKLRDIMKMMGLQMKAYWLVTYVFSFLLYFITFLLLWLLASLLGFRYYTVNAPGIVFLLFFFWGHLLVAFSLFFSVFFNRSRTAVIVGYIWVFATGLLAAQVVTEYYTNSDTPYALIFFLCLVPTFVFYRGLNILSASVIFNGNGLSWSRLVDRNMLEVWIFMIVEWAIFLLLAVYLEAVLKTGFGVKKHPLFFLQKSFWRPEKKKYVSELKSSVEGESEDVAQARTLLKEKPDDFFLRVEDLRKIYPAANGVKEKVAVKSLALGVTEGECFGFLGPNGAGKTTTINILCGLYRPTSGTALVDGKDIETEVDEVHMMMGVCPQENVLWDDLTGPEHLEFYGRIKNMKGKQLKEAIHEGLKGVNLHEETKKKSSQYSGGMKRRLSVACALMANPRLVLLDEPSTGLDPASRRQLWTLINSQKRKCSILLTTHAMEEADALCDRLGIFVNGELKCVGSSSELKQRFGKGYKLTLTCDPRNAEAANSFVQTIAPEATLLNSLAGTSNYEIPKSSVKLSQVFAEFEEKKAQYSITDWGISNTTLEEVFLKITQAEEEKEKGIVSHRSSSLVGFSAAIPRKFEETTETKEDKKESSSSSDSEEKKEEESSSSSDSEVKRGDSSSSEEKQKEAPEESSEDE